MLRQRFITGALLAAFVFSVIYFLPSPLFSLVVLIVFMFGAWEWARLSELKGLSARMAYMVMILVISGLTWWLFMDRHSMIPIIVGAVWWVLVTLALVVHEPGHGLRTSGRLVYRAAGVMTLVPAWIALTALHHVGWAVVLFLVFLIALADSAAFFTGRAFGRTKLAPSISPGKTREGLLGAMAAAVLAGGVGAWWLEIEPSLWIYFIAVCLVTTLFSVAGDLFESLLKREVGVKDSGRMLPGHGGMLDRIDSITAAAPAFALGLWWIR